jgi:hypothetical protein
MGRVIVPVLVEHALDQTRAARGEIAASKVRRVQVDALVDTKATFFCMPEALAQRLGLAFDRARETRTFSGTVRMGICAGARIEVQGRACRVAVIALPEGRPCQLGQIPPETLDWSVAAAKRPLAGNPEHGGQWMAEVF